MLIEWEGIYSPSLQKKYTMKYIIPILFLGLALWACSPTPSTPPASEPVEYGATLATPAYWSNVTDFTTDTVTDAGTLTYAIGSYNRPVAIELQISGDSLSGATAVTVTLEQSINGTNYASLGTAAINGTGTTNTRITTDVLGGTIRARAVGTGTQSTLVRMDAIVAESQPTQ